MMLLTIIAEGKDEEVKKYFTNVLGKYFMQINSSEEFASFFSSKVVEKLKSFDPPEILIKQGVEYQLKYCTDECLQIKKASSDR